MPDFYHEDACSYDIVAGIDEVGRGPLAGPVVVASVIIHDRTLPFLHAIRDSKKLSQKKRAMLAPEIIAHCSHYIAEVPVPVIDDVNILNATLMGMEECAAFLPAQHYLIDGNRVPQSLNNKASPIIKGDDHSLSIACASIIAKVHRDSLMADLAQIYPGYGWERNAGYGTKEHMQSLSDLGLTPFHRRSFAPVARLLNASTAA